MAATPDNGDQRHPDSPAGEQATPPPRQAIEVDDAGTVAAYANFCRVTGTPEELIIDFGLNPQPIGIPNQPVQVSQRIVMNYYTAKRMMHALRLTLERHESAFGPLETDIQKRVVNKRG